MEVFCFDFDGVICDSAPETALTAWNGCQEIWPDQTGAWSAALQERFCRLRPVLHTGFEAIPLMRLILDGARDDDSILRDFPALRDRLIAREGITQERLLAVFGAVRDRMIAEDEGQWLRWNRFYAGIAQLLQRAATRHPTFIITTKQERFVLLLCEHEGIELPAEHVFGLERKLTKPQLLGRLQEAPEHAGASFHFIEDRLETLKDVIADRALDQVRLYLADWGYNTPAQREEACALPRITIVSREGFARLHGLDR
jgi:phosphoglycolate phosphatase-like HAD superfamily hydrolase